MDDASAPMKRCSKCGRALPATTDYFRRKASLKSGLTSHCKECLGSFFDEEYNVSDGYKRCPSCRRILELTEANFYRATNTKSGFNGKCKACQGEQSAAWHQSNPEKTRGYKRRYEHNNPEKKRKYALQWQRDNPEKVKEIRLRNNEAHRIARKRWSQANPEKVLVYDHRHRARKAALPDTLTVQQWLLCREYFDYSCAICGRQQEASFSTYTIVPDHWIPISHPDCPGTVATNIVPLCHGTGGCNNSKSDRVAEVWLIQRFGAEKGMPF